MLGRRMPGERGCGGGARARCTLGMTPVAVFVWMSFGSNSFCLV